MAYICFIQHSKYFLLTWYHNLLTAAKQRQDFFFGGFLLGCRAAFPLLIGRSANCGTAKAILMSCYTVSMPAIS